MHIIWDTPLHVMYSIMTYNNKLSRYAHLLVHRPDLVPLLHRHVFGSPLGQDEIPECRDLHAPPDHPLQALSVLHHSTDTLHSLVSLYQIVTGMHSWGHTATQIPSGALHRIHMAAGHQHISKPDIEINLANYTTRYISNTYGDPDNFIPSGHTTQMPAR